MINWIALIFYAGGVRPAYTISRKAGRNMASAALDALTWPFDIAVSLVKKYYDPDVDG